VVKENIYIISHKVYLVLIICYFMEIKSVFENKEKLPVKFTSDGENVSPLLEISGIPDGARSLVLINDDPDAQRVIGYTWVHWVRFNIPVNGSEIRIEEGSSPGVGGFSTYKKEEYSGPNPPAGSGIHNYYFKIYAIDTELDLNVGAEKSDVEAAMEGHILDKAEIVGIYNRD